MIVSKQIILGIITLSIAYTADAWTLTNCDRSTYQARSKSKLEVTCKDVDSVSLAYLINALHSYYYIGTLTYTGTIKSVGVDAFNYNHQITKLTMNNVSLSNLQSNSFRGLDVLEELDLGNNFITNFTRSMVYSMPALRTVNLVNNQLSGVLTQTFANSSTLERVLLSTNNITGLDDTFKNVTKLETLMLDQNSISKIDDNAFADCRFLKTVNLSSNKLENIGFVSQLKAVKLLYLSDNNISNLSDGVFANCKQLVQLHLNDNKIEIIPQRAFSNLSKLWLINLRNNRINFLGTTSFQGVTVLNELDLSNNFLKEISLGTFSDLKYLANLNIGYNQLTALNKFGTFQGLGYLRKLDLSYNNFTNFDEHTFYPLIRMQTLVLDGNPISTLNISFIDHLPELKFLSLGDVKKSCLWLFELHKKLIKKSVQLQSLQRENNEENIHGIRCYSENNSNGTTETDLETYEEEVNTIKIDVDVEVGTEDNEVYKPSQNNQNPNIIGIDEAAIFEKLMLREESLKRSESSTNLSDLKLINVLILITLLIGIAALVFKPLYGKYINFTEAKSNECKSKRLSDLVELIED